jgi:hypothetical protein
MPRAERLLELMAEPPPPDELCVSLRTLYRDM